MALRSCFAVTAFLLAAAPCLAADEPATGDLVLVVPQKEYQTFEPILVIVQAPQGTAGLPMALDEKSSLRFEISPPVKPRKGAKPLPVEAKVDKARTRLYDLLEWREFPAEGTFTVRAILQNGASAAASTTATIVLRNPAKGDFERTAVERLHHLPWSNYGSDCFCGDTFDVVKSWPKSRLVPYCHYWSGLYSQHKKEHDKAAASFRTLLEDRPDAVLADHAAIGLAESLLALNRRDEALKVLQARVAAPPGPPRSDAAATILQTLLRENGK
jgi:hypothetical protein